MHVTLAFLGEQPEDRLHVLQQIGSHAATASAPGTLRLGAAGSFGSRRAPRVLWVGLGGDIDMLRTLHARLSDGLRLSGFPVEDREFSPHVTLARRRQTATGGAPAGWPPTVQPTSFAIFDLTLFESRISPRGATYIPIAKFPLAG